MSRSNPNNLVSLAKKKFEWQGSTGKIKYYDKEKGEKGENVIVDLPFTFLVLDQLSCISGFSDADQSGFWSNEVRNTKTDLLTVRTKKGVEQTALYEQLAPTLNKGAQYAQAVYIAYYEGKELAIGKFEITGSAIGAWIDFCKGKNLDTIAVVVSGATPAKKGATNYFIPVYQAKEVSEETQRAAVALDVELQKYLTAYLANKGATPETAEPKPTTNVFEKANQRRAESVPSGVGEWPSLNDAPPQDDIDSLPF